MLLYNNRKAHLFSLSDVPIYNSILILLQAPPVTVYKPLFFYVSSTILMTAYICKEFREFVKCVYWLTSWQNRARWSKLLWAVSSKVGSKMEILTTKDFPFFLLLLSLLMPILKIQFYSQYYLFQFL